MDPTLTDPANRSAVQVPDELDPNTAQVNVLLSEGNSKAKWVSEEQPYPEHPDRFIGQFQVLGREPLTGRIREYEWSGNMLAVGVAYKNMSRKELIFKSPKAWCLLCTSDQYIAYHDGKKTELPLPPAGSRKVGVQLDREAGTMSFYRVSSGTSTLLHTFTTTFTSEPLHAVFWLHPNYKMSLM